ncbi:MAG: redox-regulated ATPase YchF [Solirubrobacterales bacterium]
MQIGLVGIAQSGKSTIFQLLTGIGAAAQAKANKGVVKVPDTRIDYLSGIFKPKKTTYATLEAVDIPGLLPGQDRSSASFLSAVRDADVLMLVVQAFDNPAVPHVEGSINPFRDFELLSYELLLADLDLVEKRIERIHGGKKKKEQEEELALLERLKPVLESELPVSTLTVTEAEALYIRNYQLLTAKPTVVVLNVDESDLAGKPEGYDKVSDYCADRGIPLMMLSARIEQELSELGPEEKEMFMQDLGISEPGVQAVTRLIYSRLGLISFFTVGEDEVRAWTVEQGTVARKAAGKIHSDIERGFIRAEVIAYDDFVKAGTMGAARDAGTLRLEGKEYLVKDGDIIHYRFNV